MILQFLMQIWKHNNTHSEKDQIDAIHMVVDCRKKQYYENESKQTLALVTFYNILVALHECKNGNRTNMRFHSAPFLFILKRFVCLFPTPCPDSRA